MEYYIEISQTAQKELNSLPNDIAKRVSDKISELREHPYLGKPLGRAEKSGKMVYELRFFSPNIRVYYMVVEGTIIIENITYSGKVRVETIGDKRSQRRDLNRLL